MITSQSRSSRFADIRAGVSLNAGHAVAQLTEARTIVREPYHPNLGYLGVTDGVTQTPPTVMSSPRFGRAGWVVLPAVLAAAVAAAVLIGWATDSPRLKSLLTGHVAMQPWTGLSVILGALALAFAASPARWPRAVSVIAATALLISAVQALLQYATGRDLGTDLLLFHDAVLSGQTSPYPHPGRLGTVTAFCLATLASALLIAPLARRRYQAGIMFSALLTAALVPAVASAVFYLLGLAPTAFTDILYQMSLPTAICLSALAAGALALAPGAGWVGLANANGRPGWMTAALIAATLLFCNLGASRLYEEFSQSARLTDIPFRLQVLLSTLKDAETGQRGYLLTRQADFLEPYDAALARLPADLAAAEAALGGGRDGARLHELANERMALLARAIALGKAGDFSSSTPIVAARRGKVIMDTIRATVDVLSKDAEAAAHNAHNRLRRVIVITGLGGLLLFAGLLFSLRVTARARRAQAGSERVLALFVDRVPAAIAMFDKDMRYLAVSRRWVSAYRLENETPQSLLGRSHYELFPEIPDRWRDVHRRVLAGETLADQEDSFPREDGRTDWVRWEMTPWYTDAGSIGGALLMTELITARKETELALQASEARNRDLLTSMLDGVVLASEDGRIVSTNPAAVGMFGYDNAAEMVGQKLAILMPAAIATHHDQYLARHLSTGAAKAIGIPGRQMVGCRKNGAEFPIELSVNSFVSGDRRFFTGVMRDITDRKQAEAALANSELRLRLAVEAGQIGVFDVDICTGNICWDERMYELFGLPSGTQVTREKAFSLVHPDDAPRLQSALQAALDPAFGSSFDIEYRVVGSTGGVLRNLATHGRVSFADGKAVRILGTVTDITMQRQAEAVLARDVAELARQVAARTRDLEESQALLARAARMEALGRLAGGVAHDFNNVLQAAKGGISVAARRMGTDPAKAASFLTLADGALSRGALVTERLLAFARQSDLAAVAISPQSLLTEVSLLVTQAVGPEITLRIEVEPGVPPLLADVGQLEMVLVNLVNNARDALPERRGTIRLAAEAANAPDRRVAQLAPGQYVRLSVTDEGAGMTGEVLARVMEPFFTTKRRGEGTGLGLAMAGGFAEQSGGALSIDSAPGRGTTVSLWFPVAAEADAGQSQRQTAGSGGDARPLSLLLVDDEPVIRLVLATALTDRGHHVTEAENADEALRCMDSGLRPDAIVTDLAMPGSMDGMALVREARRRLPSVAAVLVTGHVGDVRVDDIEEIRRSGSLEVMQKPFAPDALTERIAVLMAEVG